MKMLLLFIMVLSFSCFAEFSDLHRKEMESIFERFIEPTLDRVPEEKRDNVKLLCRYINDEISDKEELLELIQKIENDLTISSELTPTESFWLSSKVLARCAHEQYFKIIGFNIEYIDSLLMSDQSEKRDLGIYLLSTQTVSSRTRVRLGEVIASNDYGVLYSYIKIFVTQVVENPESDKSVKLTDKVFCEDDICNKIYYSLMYQIKKAEYYGYKETRLTREILNNSAKRIPLDSDVLGAFVDLFDQESIDVKRKYLISELERLNMLEKMKEIQEKESGKGAGKGGSPKAPIKTGEE